MSVKYKVGQVWSLIHPDGTEGNRFKITYIYKNKKILFECNGESIWIYLGADWLKQLRLVRAVTNEWDCTKEIQESYSNMIKDSKRGVYVERNQ